MERLRLHVERGRGGGCPTRTPGKGQMESRALKISLPGLSPASPGAWGPRGGIAPRPGGQGSPGLGRGYRVVPSCAKVPHAGHGRGEAPSFVPKFPVLARGGKRGARPGCGVAVPLRSASVPVHPPPSLPSSTSLCDIPQRCHFFRRQLALCGTPASGTRGPVPGAGSTKPRQPTNPARAAENQPLAPKRLAQSSPLALQPRWGAEQLLFEPVARDGGRPGTRLALCGRPGGCLAAGVGT